ncbi:MAG: hypothetical protein FRX49_12398 [Trebouxia sp. A1-2]|nr:MAG: hypothetical protein FRX49_12398 [Trebouxia sp. A1-2]
MPAATHGMVDPDGPWRPSTSQRSANLSSQYYPSHPGTERPHTASILQRPLYAPSRHNQESLDRQAAADQAAYERKGNIYWPHASHHQHHPAVGTGASVEQEGYLNGPNQPWGRAQGHYQGHMGSFNPITGQWAQEPAHSDRARESFLPGSKARQHNCQQEAAYGPDSVGKYDPILHKWILEPDQEKWAARERAHANQTGIRIEGRPGHLYQVQGHFLPSPDWLELRWRAGPGPCATRLKGTYDPITNQWLHAPAGNSRTRLLGTDRVRMSMTWAVNKTGRLCVSHNTRLGVYDPIRNVWQVPPSNVEEHDEQMRLKAHGHIPIKRKVPSSPNVGVYDPVRNDWLVLPQNQRIIGGLTFQPHTLF